MRQAALGIIVCGLSACTAVRIDSSPTDGPDASLTVRALEHGTTLTRDYRFDIEKEGKLLAGFDASGILVNLRPGRYRVHIRGRGIDRTKVKIDLHGGEHTTCTLLAGHARRLERYEETFKEVLATIGRVVAYTVLAIAVIAALLLDACTDGDEDDRDDCSAPLRPLWPRACGDVGY